MATHRAVIQKDDHWWIGSVEEIPGVNSQGHTREELMANLQSALEEAVELNRAETLVATHGGYEGESLQA